MRVYESLALQCGQGRGNLLAAVQSPVRVLVAVLQTLGHQLQSVSVNTRIVTLPQVARSPGNPANAPTGATPPACPKYGADARPTAGV